MKYWSEENGETDKQTAQNQMDETYCQDLHCLPSHKCIGLNRLNGTVHEISVPIVLFFDHVEMVSLPIHTFSWASLTKLLTST